MYCFEFHEGADSSGSRVTELRHAGRVLDRLCTEATGAVPGYRFLPVFFLANAVCLGWSPTLQRLGPGLLLPDRPTTVGEESAEHAAAALAHVFALDRLDTDVEHLLDPDLVTAAVRLTTRTAPHLTAADWEHTLWTGLRAWRELYRGCGAVVVADPELRCLRVSGQPLSAPRSGRG
ncbi:hypothetical protein AB0G32_37520 [Streptomyces sp. NPDC023723]|uniref:hypothetical protein n=1 Tax=Streptomyces sp. NPDC023723 TaxID=3154323 RepID=UPI0033EC6ED2